jgi:hypothetical protein
LAARCCHWCPHQRLPCSLAMWRCTWWHLMDGTSTCTGVLWCRTGQMGLHMLRQLPKCRVLPGLTCAIVTTCSHSLVATAQCMHECTAFQEGLMRACFSLCANVCLAVTDTPCATTLGYLHPPDATWLPAATKHAATSHLDTPRPPACGLAAFQQNSTAHSYPACIRSSKRLTTGKLAQKGPAAHTCLY